ncbi:MAG: type II toxin-antitoxin system VapC family toxin [Syntrophobacteraceae bacterium]
MKFWDSSAIVPLLFKEEKTEYCFNVANDDPRMLIWCLSRVEVVSAMCRRAREGRIGAEEFAEAKKRLAIIMSRADEVTSVARVRARALRLLEVHSLRGADACQLGAALVGSREDPERLPILCFDDHLRSAAMKEGFIVNP